MGGGGGEYLPITDQQSGEISQHPITTNVNSKPVGHHLTISPGG